MSEKRIKKGSFSPLSNVVFCSIFSKMENAELLREFLNLVLEDVREPLLREIVEMKSEYVLLGKVMEKGSAVSRGGRLDVRAKADDGTLIDVEVQLTNDRFINDRSLFYAAKQMSESTEEGQSFEKLPHVIAVNLLKHGLRKEGEEYHNVAKMVYCNGEPGRIATDVVELHNLELDQFEKVYGKLPAAELSRLGRWLRYMTKGYQDGREREVLLKMDDKLRAFAEEYQIALDDPLLKERYNFHMSAIIDQAFLKQEYERIGKELGLKEGLKQGLKKGKKEGKREGLEQGVEKGRVEQARETARAMLREGLEKELIHRVTKLTVEQLEELKRNDETDPE